MAIRWRVSEDTAYNQQHWICRYRAVGEVYYHYQEAPLALYLTCAYCAIQMFGGGTGTIGPQNDPENVFVFFCVIAGTMLWAIFVGAVCSIQTNIDPAEQEYLDSLDRLNYLMNDLAIPSLTRQRAREYLMNTKAAIKRSTYPDVIAKFENSSRLHSELAAGLGATLLHRVPSSGTWRMR